jgi:hypothetical protein
MRDNDRVDASQEVSSESKRAAPEVAATVHERPGATFLRADLQVHTPIDPHFEPGPEPEEAVERLALAETYLSQAKDRGIELVGITEHNDVSWIDELRTAAKKLDMHLLPGFEVESAEGIHVLCLFDPGTPVSHLENTLAQLGLTEAKRKKSRLELRTRQSFADLLELIQGECEGICIAAHIESSKGLLAAIREGARVDAWKTKGLLAAQIARPPEEITSGNGRIIRGEEPIYGRDRLPGYVMTSDARTMDRIGTVSTWIKMDSIGVSGLRQAFLDPESRIAFADPTERRRGSRLLGAAWEGDFLDGVSFPLNPELNCLIGGKGTGKSTAIETIRYALDVDYNVKSVKTAAEELLGHSFRSGSKVSVVVETETPKRRYVIERTAPHAPVVRDLDGMPLPELDAKTLLSPRIYGQKEIYGIAQDAEARLEMLDGFAAHDLRDIVDREQAFFDRCEENAAVIVRTIRRIDEAESKLGELPNLEEWRERFRQAGFETLLSERRRLDREERLLQAADQEIARLSERLRSLATDTPKLAAALDQDGDDTLPNADLLARAATILGDTDLLVAGNLGELEQKMGEARAALTAVREEWAQRREARSAEFDRALRTLQEKAPDVDPERYLDVERRIEQLLPLKSALEGLRAHLDTARKERATLLVDLEDVRGEKHRARRRAADRLNEALDGNVRIDLEHQGVREPFLERLISLRTGTRQDALRRLIEHAEFSPSAFAKAVRQSALETAFGLPQGQATTLQRALDETTLLELELVELPDRVALALDIAVGEARHEYRDLSRLSPGQKSTAILLLVMQESTDPLLIDQPEDDLDNRFIYDDIVKRLKRAKPERQFIIATHNANIPVLGDAEQIVALDAEESPGAGRVSSFVRAHGSIDADKVRAAAEHILEGGEEAFALRRAKYET